MFLRKSAYLLFATIEDCTFKYCSVRKSLTRRLLWLSTPTQLSVRPLGATSVDKRSRGAGGRASTATICAASLRANRSAGCSNVVPCTRWSATPLRDLAGKRRPGLRPLYVAGSFALRDRYRGFPIRSRQAPPKPGPPRTGPPTRRHQRKKSLPFHHFYVGFLLAAACGSLESCANHAMNHYCYVNILIRAWSSFT